MLATITENYKLRVYYLTDVRPSRESGVDELAEEIHEKMASNETLENANEKVAHWWNRAWQWVTQSDT